MKVAIVDDELHMRQSISQWLALSGYDTETFASAREALSTVGQGYPGVVLTDIRMPEMDGMTFLKRLMHLDSSLPVIMITGHADVPLAVEAMKAGVADFIEKPFDDDVLLAAIGAALRDGEKDRQGAAEAAEITARMDTLSGREREVLGGLVAGHANKVIAFDLGISPRTVEIYRANVMTKMKAASLSELLGMAMLAERG